MWKYTWGYVKIHINMSKSTSKYVKIHIQICQNSHPNMSKFTSQHVKIHISSPCFAKPFGYELVVSCLDTIWRIYMICCAMIQNIMAKYVFVKMRTAVITYISFRFVCFCWVIYAFGLSSSLSAWSISKFLTTCSPVSWYFNLSKQYFEILNLFYSNYFEFIQFDLICFDF